MPATPTPHDIGRIVKKVIARRVGKPTSKIRYADKLEADHGLSQSDRFGLAPLLNAGFNAEGFQPDPRLHERSSETAKTVGIFVAYYRDIFEV